MKKPIGWEQIEGVKIIKTPRFSDNRGSFMESHNKKNIENATSREINFVQDNISKSFRHVLRGLHIQIDKEQGKLVRAISGCIWDIAVDLRKYSPTYKEYTFNELSEDNNLQLWVPEGFAHGFYTVSDVATVIYKVNQYWQRESERTIIWNDSDLSIDWGFKGDPVLSEKDQLGLTLEKYNESI